MQELWVPQTEHQRRVRPDERKHDGGSYFDDELDTQDSKDQQFYNEMQRLIDHIQKRPDHTVYVGSAEERSKMRDVFNNWKLRGVINHNPNIRIEYGVPDGSIRVDV